MGRVPVESIRELSQTITESFLQEQKAMRENVQKLVIILHAKNKPTYRDEEREADLRQSNTKPSQDRREALYRAQVIKAMQEKKEIQKIFAYFLEQQKEFLALETRRDLLREQGEKKLKEEHLYSLNEKDKQRLAKLLLDIANLAENIHKILDVLLKAIKQLQDLMIENNIKFIANFEKSIRSDLEALGERTEDGFNLTVGDKKVSIIMDEMIQIFTNVNEKAFFDISQGKQVEINEMRQEVERGVKSYIISQDKNVPGETSESDRQKAVADIMQVWNKQVPQISKALALQTEIQNEVNFCRGKADNFQRMDEHIGGIKQNFTTLSDIFKDDIGNAEECVEEMDSIVGSFNLMLVQRAGSTVTALVNEQAELSKAPNIENAPEQNAQISSKPTGGGML